MKYIAFLRGINVGGSKKIIMKELAAAFTDAGYEDVKTYIQSGNVLFSTVKKSPSSLEKDASALIKKSFGHDVEIMVRTGKEMNDIIKAAPFKKKDIDSGKLLYITMLKEKLTVENVKLLKSLTNPQEIFHYHNKEIYTIRDPKVSYDKAVLGTFDKKLKVSTTTRNWNVMNKLNELINES
ncbi:MAG TPA: DUF1697 domain-containing protein [Ignavibacteria bacterium]|nr:DUF1697 domain-containing protein [Ignavibacteria bacterium]